MNKCIFCEEELTLISKEDKYSPYEGGEVRFIFSFGSTAFDKCIGNTVYSGLICDHCASKFINRMDEELIEC
jgi:hypothetical protein